MSTEKKTSITIKPTREAYEEWEKLNRLSFVSIGEEDEEPSFYRKPRWLIDHRNRTAIDLRNLPCKE